MARTSDKTLKKQRIEAAVIVAKNTKELNTVRWYLMIYPYGRKGLTVGVEREIERRKTAGESSIEYFAPHYVEAKEVDGKIVTTDTPLLENYLFVHASIKEIFRMKRYEEQYNLPKRACDSKGRQYYPYVSDEVICNLQWIARSYSGTIPLFSGDTTSWLAKGDRIRITSGPFKGMEATLYANKKNRRKEVMVTIDEWMTVPLLHIKANQYTIISLNDEVSNNLKIDDKLIHRLHEIWCCKYNGNASQDDLNFVSDVVSQYTIHGNVHSNIMRYKLYAALLIAYAILQDIEKLENLRGIIHSILPTITIEQSKALLLSTLYGCTDNELYYSAAHRIIDSWKTEDNLKRNKRQLIERLDDYDHYFHHK